MKKVIIVLFVLISIASYSQQIVRGYSASYSYGLLSTGDDFTINYVGADYTAEAREGIGSNLNFSFPFDFGVNRHRLFISPGIDILTVKYELDVDPDISFPSPNSDSLLLRSMKVMPQVGLMYKYHFYAGSLHLSLGAGLDFKLPVSNEVSLTTKDKADVIVYTESPIAGDDKLLFQDNTVYSNMKDLGFHISPKVGLDIYVTRYLVTNIYYYTSPLTNFSDTPVIRGFGGFGVTYLVPMGKEDDSRILQYYKN